MPGMRKWKWVAAGLALVASGVTAYLLSQPRVRSIQYHKEQYLKGPSLAEKWMEDHLPGDARFWFWQRRNTREDFHYRALVQLGYLEERVFSLSNHLAPEWDDLDGFRARVYRLTDQLTNMTSELNQILDVATNSITVVGPREQMVEWAEAIREADLAVGRLRHK